NNGIKYMIFTLEPWPRAAVLDWVNLTLQENQDKYAIIYTYSFIDSSGGMYTMWDWSIKGDVRTDKSTYLRYCNISSMGNPRDGDQLWNYCFSKNDNILAVISAYGGASDVALTKFKNSNGIEVAAICTNADKLYSTVGLAMFNVSISEDNKTVTCSYLSPFNGYLDTSLKSIKLNKIATLTEPKIELPKIATQYNGANKAYIFGYEGNTFRPNANMTRAEACTIFARLILGVQSIPDGYVTRFTDVKTGDWFYNAVAFLDQNGFFEQLTSSTYKPNEPITRAEFVDLANKASSLTASTKKIEFADVPTTHFYYDSIIAAAGAGLVNGYEDSTFRPDNTITRAEVVTVVNRLLGLKSTAKTIDTSKLENEFVDIGTHWARLNILMASNSNVHGSYYYTKTLDGVTETSKNLTFTNKHFSFTVEKRSGKVIEIINRYTNEDINNNAKNPNFIYLVSDGGAKIVPVSMSIDGNRIKVDFKNGSSVYLIVEITDDLMTFEIDSELAPGVLTVVYGILETNIKISNEPDSFRINGIGMTAWTQVSNYLLGEYTNTIAQAHSNYDAGTMGSKYGIVFSKYSDTIPFMQKAMDAVDTSVGLALKSAGAYTKEWEPIYDDYAIRGDTNPETIDEYIALCKEYGVDTIDLHMGGTTFLNGNFKFAYTESGTAKEYYEKIGYKFKEAGLKTALHSYAWYIDYTATDITTNPYWQKQLLKRDDVYTLSKDMTKFRSNVPTVEDATGFDATTSFFVANSNFILIDEEIIKVGSGTDIGFVSIKRGQCGTEATTHKAGAKIYHLSGHFGKLVPEYGSELFWRTADLMAEAYNDGQFDMLYFDAIDGCGADINACYSDKGWSAWYWHQMYIHRIVSQCERTPIVETSSGCGQEYNFRGRMGAYDYPSRAYKISIQSHAKNNLKAAASNIISTLGWWNFRPDEAPTAGMYNTIQKTQFFDDVDYLGMTSVIYDMTMVYNPLPSTINENPFMKANISHYNDVYAKLRKSHYFTDEVKQAIIEKGGEWKIIEKAPGEYAFLHMYYSQANLGNDLTSPNYSFKGNNPFDAQTPFVRVEPRWSTEYEDPITLVEFDESKTLSQQTLTVTGLSVNMSKNMAMKVKVKGTGKDGDAILISLTGGLTSGESNGHSDYFIDLNYEGWKEFVMLDADNAEYDTAKYKFGAPIYNVGGDYGTVRSTPNFANIVKVVVYTCGSTAKTAQMSSITAYKQNQARVKNPTVSVGSSKMTFNTEIDGGNYIEYYPTENKAYLYNNKEQTKTEIGFTGTLNVATGDFICTYSAEALTSSTLRARVTLGFSGEEITN
ncbi:MAG: S-layer homology domain-containing protein, partial [Clostridia bacterium]|nr:S-layer homology domain-containing protein [Clostridia bacterium]